METLVTRGTIPKIHCTTYNSKSYHNLWKYKTTRH